MLDKEDIETCKQEARNYIEFMETAGDNAGWTRGLLWYIEELEKKVKDKYWEGYVDKTKEALEICKKCPRVIKLKKLEGELKVYKEK